MTSKLIDPDTLRKELRRTLSNREAERIVARIFGPPPRVSMKERARRAALEAERLESKAG